MERAWLCLLCSLPSGLFFALMRCPLSLLVPRLNSPSSLSLSSEERCCSALMIFTAVCWALSSTCLSLCFWGTQKRARCSGCGITSAKWRGRLTFLTSVLLTQPRTRLVFLVARARCWLPVSLVPTGTCRASSAKLLSSQAAQPAGCAGAWACPSPGAGLCASPG